MNDQRQQDLTNWVNGILNQLIPDKREPIALEAVSGDASFRRYFRARLGMDSYIAVDAPPENEDNKTFVRICNILRTAGVAAPKIYSVDYDLGFLLLVDFGDELYLGELKKAQEENNIARADELYGQAISELVDLQANTDKEILDSYDRKELHREMSLFEHWFCVAFLEVDLEEKDSKLIADTFHLLEDAALDQPQVVVHRDYHSRNLMCLDQEIFGEHAGPGVIDFQDAVRGPYTYDLVSLLRDCYICWQPELVEKWAQSYLEQALRRGIIPEERRSLFQRDFDLMGLQRHLKVMGIFARLCIRDNKPRYLADIPLVIQYFLEVGQRYPELTPFVDWFKQEILPKAKVRLNPEP